MKNNTGWEIGYHNVFDLPNNYIMSCVVRENYYKRDSLGRIHQAPYNKPFNVVIEAIVCERVLDTDGEYFYQLLDSTQEIFEEQSDFWRYCAKVAEQLKTVKELSY